MEDGIQVQVGSLVLTGGGMENGTVIVDDNETAGYLGQDLVVKYATVNVAYLCTESVTLNVGHFGGNVNLRINGDLANEDGLAALDGQTLGGVGVAVSLTGANSGFITLTGNVNTLGVGGQAFAVDHICHVPCQDPQYVEFEDLDGEKLGVGEQFSENGATMMVQSFTFANGTVFDGGFVQGDDAGNAGHLGRDLLINNANVGFNFGGCADTVQFHYGEVGGSVNLTVNGQLANTDDLADLDGVELGGVSVSVQGDVVNLEGEIDSLSVGGQEFWIDHVCFEPCGLAIDCVDFEDLDLGKKYAAGDQFTEDGVAMTVGNFLTAGGQSTSGNATVDDSGAAGHTGQELNLNNVLLDFEIDCAEKITFHYGFYGGDVGISINDNYQAVNGSFTGLPAVLGGASISITSTPVAGGQQGVVTITGEIQQFSVGGQELWIDHVCITPCDVQPDDCIDFEEETLDTEYSNGDSLTEDSVTMELVDFVWAGGTIFSGGLASIENAGLAGHSGQDLNLNNVSLEPAIGCADRISLSYADFGGNVNLWVNGVLRNTADLIDLDGTVVGGANVAVTMDGGFVGTVVVSGAPITQFAIGGQEFWVDHICIDPCEDPPMDDCIDFEDPAVESRYDGGESLTEDGTTMTTEPFQWANGQWTNDGYAEIDDQSRAGHLGKDIILNNVNLDFEIVCADRISLAYADIGGNVNLSVNGEHLNVEDLVSLDGSMVGGAMVGVSASPGMLVISGAQITQFSIGGQEFWIDHVCITPCEGPLIECIDYEMLEGGAEYLNGEMFAEDGFGMDVQQFQRVNGTWTSAGRAVIDNGFVAGHLGQDVHLDNANLNFDVGCAERISLNYAELEGNVNLMINGDFRNAADLVDLDGLVVGGINVSATPSRGTLVLAGDEITQFAIGGQIMWIDHVCITPCPPKKENFRILGIGASPNAGMKRVFFSITVPGVPGTLILESSSDLGAADPWADTGAIFTPMGSGNYNTYTDEPVAEERKFYRVR